MAIRLAATMLTVLIPGSLVFAQDTGARPLGMNLSGVTDWSSELVFVDAFKTARAWISQAPGQPWGRGGPLDLDDKGNVKQLAASQFAETLLFVDQLGRYPSGNYICLYDGKGELGFGYAARVKESKPGRIVVGVDSAKGQIGIKLLKTDAADPVRNIRFILPGFEKTYRVEPFHPSFLARWKGFRVLRFMDWGRTNDSAVVKWTDRATPDHHSQALQAGVALEYQIALANAIGADAWFCVPHRAEDAYVREMAKLVRAKLDPKHVACIEYSNETWNTIFAQAHYCKQQGQKLELSRRNDYEAQLRYSAQRSVEIFKLFEAEFGKESKSRLVRVLAAQSANPWTGTTVMEWNDAFKSADAIAIAPYFGNSLGDPKRAEQVAKMTVDEVLTECRKSIEDNAGKIKAYAGNAKKRGLKLLAYEGGQHLVGYGGAENNAKLMELFHAANRHAGMKELYLADLKSWFANGGDVFCVFASVGRYSKWGSWGVLEYHDQDETKAPKMRAIREWLAGK